MSKRRRILNVYPDNIIQERIKDKSISTLYAYVDLRNTMTSLFVGDIASEIVHDSDVMNNFVSSEIYQSILYFSSVWKSFAIENDLNFKIFFSYDYGDSIYHKHINSNYKKSRKLRKSNIPYFDEIADILCKNAKLCDKVCNGIPDVYFINLNYLESDFIPYYLMTRKFRDDNGLHLIFSNDKDHYQVLNRKNTHMISRKQGLYHHINYTNFMQKFLNLKEQTSHDKYHEYLEYVDRDYFSLILAICGDSSDDIAGVPNIGPKTVVKLFYEYKNMLPNIVGSIEDIIQNAMNNDPIFNKDHIPGDSRWSKILEHEDQVRDSFKLISYECLSRWLEQGNSTTINEKKDIIDNTIDNKINDWTLDHVLDSSGKYLQDWQLTKDNIGILYES